MSCRSGWRWRESRTKACNCPRTMHLGDQTESPKSSPHHPMEKLRLRERQQGKHLKRAHRVSSALPQRTKSLGTLAISLWGKVLVSPPFHRGGSKPREAKPPTARGQGSRLILSHQGGSHRGTCLGSTRSVQQLEPQRASAPPAAVPATEAPLGHTAWQIGFISKCLFNLPLDESR